MCYKSVSITSSSEWVMMRSSAEWEATFSVWHAELFVLSFGLATGSVWDTPCQLLATLPPGSSSDSLIGSILCFIVFPVSIETSALIGLYDQ